jgi:hypothetical protein
MTEVTFKLIGFSELEKPLAYIATSMTANLFFPNGNYPPLRSNVIRIVRKSTAPVPLYVADVPVELIIVNCTENRPWQYTYQVAHEFGHLGTRADKRYPRLDGNKWIEEAICGAYSVYAGLATTRAGVVTNQRSRWFELKLVGFRSQAMVAGGGTNSCSSPTVLGNHRPDLGSVFLEFGRVRDDVFSD